MCRAPVYFAWPPHSQWKLSRICAKWKTLLASGVPFKALLASGHLKENEYNNSHPSLLTTFKHKNRFDGPARPRFEASFCGHLLARVHLVPKHLRVSTCQCFPRRLNQFCLEETENDLSHCKNGLDSSPATL